MSHATDHEGRLIDFGKTAGDYDKHRPGFPDSMFELLAARGFAHAGQRALDIGTGTGSLALSLAARGLEVTGLDPSPQMLAVAERRAETLGFTVRWVEATGEATGLLAASFNLVTAGQCWWWLDGARAVAEARRVLRPGGRLLIANFCYLPTPGTLAARTEALILAHNPGWAKSAEVGIFPEQVRDLDAGGFTDVESASYTETITFSHESWRGRIRACNGVGAALEPAEVAAFDGELARLLAQDYPGNLAVPHRIFIATGRAP